MIYSLLGSVSSFENYLEGGERPAPPPSFILQKRSWKLQNQDLEKPRFGKTVLILKKKKIQDSHTDEEARGIAKKNAIFVGEDKESTKGEEQEKIPRFKASGRTGIKAKDKQTD